MDVCAEYRIPHSEFLSWDEIDQDKALALVLVKNEDCPRCGTSRVMWKRDRFALQAVVGVCRGCELKAFAEEEIEEGSHHGRYVYFEPKPHRHKKK